MLPPVNLNLTVICWQWNSLNQKYPDLNLHPQECLAIEDTPAGIQAAKRAQYASCWCSEYLPISYAPALL